MSTQTTAVPALAPQFDLNDPQHLAMRKLMANAYARHAIALERGLPESAARNLGIAQGFDLMALVVFKDWDLSALAAELETHMLNLERAHFLRATA